MEKNLSGVSYSRNCIVYDYILTDEKELEDDFHLIKDNIKVDNLVKKYTYQEVISSIDDKKYLVIIKHT